MKVIFWPAAESHLETVEWVLAKLKGMQIESFGEPNVLEPSCVFSGVNMVGNLSFLWA